MDSAVSRRDLHTAISSAASDSDGLAPPSMIVEDVGSISMRKLRDCSPMSSAPTFTTKHGVRMKILEYPSVRPGGGQNSKVYSGRTGGPPSHEKSRN